MNNDLTVLFATTTGNAEECAQQAAKRLTHLGFQTKTVNMKKYSTDELVREGLLLIVVSTWGDGEPPDDALPFWEKVLKLRLASLAGIRYSVLALGDSSYERFCQFGREFDIHMEKLGAIPIASRVECDGDYQEPLETWLQQVQAALPAHAESRC